MIEQLKTFIFCPEITYGEFRNVVMIFFPRLAFLSDPRKYTKTETSVRSRKMAEISAQSRGK